MSRAVVAQLLWWVEADRFWHTGGQDLDFQRKQCSVSLSLCSTTAYTLCGNQWHCHSSYLAARDHTESRKQEKVTWCGVPCHWLSSFHASRSASAPGQQQGKKGPWKSPLCLYTCNPVCASLPYLTPTPGQSVWAVTRSY